MSGVLRVTSSEAGTPQKAISVWDCGDFGLDQRIPTISEKPEGFLQALNGYFTRKRSFKNRPGTSNLLGTMSLNIMADGVFNFWINNLNEYTLSVCNGILYQYNWNNSTWTVLSIQAIQNLAVVFSGTAGTLAIGTYEYEVTALNYQGETNIASISITTTAVGSNVLSWTSQSAATKGYNIYGRLNGSLELLANVQNPTFTDNGSISPAAPSPPGINSAAFKVGHLFSFAVLESVIVFGNGYDHNYSYDGTTLLDLDPSASLGSAGLVPCAYFIRHLDRIFASGNFYAPTGLIPQSSWVYWCGNDEPTNWSQAGIDAGSVGAAQGDDVIVGIASYHQDLYIFKGPTHPSYFILSGTSYNNFTLVPGHMNVTGFHHSIVTLENDILIGSIDGFYSLRATWTGTIDQARISDPVLDLVASIIDPSKTMGVYDPFNNVVVWYVNTGGAYLTTAIVMTPPDQASKNYRWSTWNVLPTKVAQWSYSSILGWTTLLSSANGDLNYWDWYITQDLGTEFPCTLSPNYTNFGDIRMAKRIKDITATFLSSNIIISAQQANGVSSTINMTGVASDTWGINDGIWGTNNGIWQVPISSTVNAFFVGISNSWSFAINKTIGYFEIFNFQVQVDFGAFNMRS